MKPAVKFIFSTLVITLCAISVMACSSVRRVKPPTKVCSINFRNYDVLQHIDESSGFKFFYPKEFTLQVNKANEKIEYRAVHKNGFHELSVTVIDSITSEPTRRERSQIVLNQITEIK